MSEFSDRPFVAGSLVGLRAFAVDSLGRLIGPSYAQVFKPGENVAECRRDTGTGMFATGGFLSAAISSWQPAPMRFVMGPGDMTYTYDPGEPPSAEEVEAQQKAAAEERARKEEERKKNHSLAGVICTCGFYAYFTGRNDYKSPANVTAIIEGYGVCTVGTAGFRAEKARLVALVRPGKKVPLSLLERNYPDVPMFESKREALAAHPLTTDPLPSPSEDDFWTREASR